MKDNFKQFLESKKVKVTLLSVLSSILATVLFNMVGIQDDTITQILAILNLPAAAYIGGQSYVDGKIKK